MSTSGNARSPSRGFTLIELLVVVAIIALLISILLPSLNRARELALSAKCLSNMRSLATAMALYADGHNGFPPVMTEKINVAFNTPGSREDSPLIQPRTHDEYYNEFWSGILISEGLMSLQNTICTKPRGFTGQSARFSLPTSITPIPDEPADWYRGEANEELPGYDYVMSFSMLGPRRRWIDNTVAQQPRFGTEAKASRTPLVVEWNVKLTWVSYNQVQNHNANSGMGVFGFSGSDGWGRRLVRHIGGQYGSNHFAFADAHAEAVEARFDEDFWYTGYSGGISSNNAANIYPEIAWSHGWSTEWWFAWSVTDE